MHLQIAKREQARIRLALQGPSGSGKTWGALQVAYGLIGDWRKIAVIDTEHNSASLYSHLGPFNTLVLKAPFEPEKFVKAIQLCESHGIEVIIIDSISHVWDGPGGVLDIHGSMAGNSFTNWNKVTPRFNEFVQSMLQSPAHIIASMRSKQDYVLTEKNGKQVPEKVGLKPVQRDGVDYEFTVVFDVDVKHNATASKDRTSLFADKPPFRLTPSTGEIIRLWCKEGDTITSDKDMISKIRNAQTVQELRTLFKSNPSYQESLLQYFSERKKQLLSASIPAELVSIHNHSTNGTHHGAAIN